MVCLAPFFLTITSALSFTVKSGENAVVLPSPVNDCVAACTPFLLSLKPTTLDCPTENLHLATVRGAVKSANLP